MTVLARVLSADWEKARAAGANRQQWVNDHFVSSLRIRGDDRENVVGAVAEYAFAAAIRVPPPRFRTDRPNDPGYEFDTVVGRIDVKGAASRPYFIGVKDTALAKHPGADFYALLHCPVDYPRSFCVGFATRREMEAAPHVAHALDPLRRHSWDPRNRELPDQPGRWLHVQALHRGGALIDGIRRGVAATLWVCPPCGKNVSVFSPTRPPCRVCHGAMVEAGSEPATGG